MLAAMSEEHPGYVLRSLRNLNGAPMKFPSVPAEVAHGEVIDVVYVADQAVPQGFIQEAPDVPCTEDGTPLKPAKAAASKPEAPKGKADDDASSEAPSKPAAKASE